MTSGIELVTMFVYLYIYSSIVIVVCPAQPRPASTQFPMNYSRTGKSFALSET